MARYTSKYTGAEIDKRLTDVGTLNTDIDNIKKQFGDKAGYIALLNSDTTTNIASVGLFASNETYTQWKNDPDNNGDLLLSNVDIPMGTGGGSTEASYIVKLVNMGDKAITAIKPSDLVAKIRFTSQLYDPSDGSTTDTDEEATLTIETRIQGAESWTAAATMDIASQPTSDAGAYTTIDISPYIKSGTQSIRFIAVGKSSEKKTTYANMTVTKTDIAVTFNTQWQNPFLYRAAAPTISIPLRITGNINKTLHLRVISVKEGVNYSKEYEYSIGTTTYTETSYSAQIDHPRGHGLYNIEAWITSGDSVSTTPVSQQIMCRLDGDTTSLLAINNIGVFQNWSNVSAFDYAIYNPNADTTNIDFALTTVESGDTIFSEAVQNVKNGEVNSLVFDLEVETVSNENFAALMSFMSNGAALRDNLRVIIDNTENFAPTAGADFHLNPKVRNNTESNPGTIINSVNGQTVKSTFEGLSFISDGWVLDKETNSRCLRVLDGSKVAINYDAYSDTTGDDGLTIEIDFATRNVTDENGTLFQMGTAQEGELPVGFWLKAQEGCFMTLNARNESVQNFPYSHDKRTHMMVNIVPNLYGEGLNYVRVFINGGIRREFLYRDNDSFWQTVDGTKKTGGILIAPQGADIDIYGLRIYKKPISANEIRQNCTSAFPTIEEKKAFKEKNDILGDNGLINYEKTKQKYNTILYKGGVPSLSRPDATRGDIIIHKPGDPAHSGILYNMNRKGQGSTSKKYWDWNTQSDFKAADSRWVDENGVDHGKCYQIADGLPMAKKLVDKRNWASSMQSHKMGATRLYNDVYQEVVGKNEITSTPGYENCRVAVYEEPFLVFQQESEDQEPVFIGMGTFGPGKADKPTFGAGASDDMLMIEGSDNNPRLTKHQVPWIDGIVHYDENEEGYIYGGTTCWDYDMGNRNTITRFIDAFNFVYEHSKRIKPFNGTLSQLKVAKDLDISYCYWVTKAEEGSAKYDLYVYDEVEKDWLPGGTSLNEDGTHKTFNVKEQLKSLLGNDFTNHETYLEWDKVNEDFIKARKVLFKENFDKFFHPKDIMFFMCMMMLLGATDNRAKNTYLWVFNNTALIRAFQDDLDSIFAIDNQGKFNKPYWVEEHDYDEILHKYFWNGEDNALYNMIEDCYQTELKTTMNEILTAMSKLGGGSLMGCWEKYFFSTTQYFPAVAYNEFARIGYEHAQKKMEDGEYNNDTQPITQSLGSQEEGERQWLEDRTMYISSYCGFGEFASTSNSNKIIARSTEQMDVKMPFTAAMWMYPVVTLGQTTVLSGQRVKAGESLTANFRTDGNTQYALYGVDYMSDIGTWYDKPANEGITFMGKRVKELLVGNDDVNAIHMKITSINVAAMTSLRTLDVHNLTTLAGSLDLSKNGRLVSVDARGTNITEVVLPKQEFLTSVKLPGTITGLELDGQRKLSALSVADYSKLQRFSINQTTCPQLDSYSFISLLQSATNVRGNLTFANMDWANVKASDITWLLDMNAKVSGRIVLASAEKIDATMKMRMVGAWGNVDDEENALYISYNKVAITSAKLSGKTYFAEEGTYSLKLTTMPTGGNDIIGISWQMSSNSFASIDSKTGVITVNEVGSKENDDKATVTATISLSSDKVITSSVDVHFYKYECQLGDYLFTDGTYGHELGDSEVSPVGVVFYLEPIYRRYALAVALNDYGSRIWGLYNSADGNNGMAGITLGDDPNYNVYDVPMLDNYTQSYQVNDSTMLDADATDNDGFKVYPKLTTIGDIGFVEITDTMYNRQGLGVYMERASLSVGDMISEGQLKTFRIMKHRDKILADSNINLPIPAAEDGMTEAESLAQCISSVLASHNNQQKYQQYYYPAASYCYAYEPRVRAGEELADNLKANNWFLASMGEWSRLSFYQRHGTSDADEYAIFFNAFNDGKFAPLTNNWFWSSAEYSAPGAWYINPQTGQVYGTYGAKCNAVVVRPVVAFRL